MNTKLFFIVVILISFISTLAALTQESRKGKSGFPILTGTYLGQKPPGMMPEVFAPGIISTAATEGGSSFSPDGNFYFFARARSSLDGILIMQPINGVWTKPQLAPFSAGKHDWDFMLAPDGKTVFVASARPLRKGESPTKDHQIWVSEKTDKGWSESRMLPSPVYSGQHDSYPSVTRDGTLYFFSNRSGGLGNGDIYRSRKTNGKYEEVENLSEPINTEHHEVDPFIAPDESYLIFCSDKPGGFGNEDIYITFQNKDGSWTKPVNMCGKINSPYDEYIPYITPDGKYFFFTTNKTGNRDIYWMDARIIEELKPNK